MRFKVQCDKCHFQREVTTANLPRYKFKCFNSNCERSAKPKQMRSGKFYNFRFNEVKT